MPLLNYTTDVPAIRTAGEIETCLVQHGAKRVLKDYDDNGHIESMSFAIPGRFSTLQVRLPIKIKQTHEVLKRQKAKNRNSKIVDTIDQAERVAIRIIKDLVEVQMAALETESVTIEEVFLPYLIVNAGGQTMYEVMESRQFMLGSGRE